MRVFDHFATYVQLAGDGDALEDAVSQAAKKFLDQAIRQ